LGHLGPPGLTEQGLVREFLTETHQVSKKKSAEMFYFSYFSFAHWIHMFLGLLDPDQDLLARGMDPDPDPAPDPDPYHSIIKQKRKTLISTVL
jgi:hypothetical protein